MILKKIFLACSLFILLSFIEKNDTHSDLSFARVRKDLLVHYSFSSLCKDYLLGILKDTFDFTIVGNYSIVQYAVNVDYEICAGEQNFALVYSLKGGVSHFESVNVFQKKLNQIKKTSNYFTTETSNNTSSGSLYFNSYILQFKKGIFKELAMTMSFNKKIYYENLNAWASYYQEGNKDYKWAFDEFQRAINDTITQAYSFQNYKFNGDSLLSVEEDYLIQILRKPESTDSSIKTEDIRRKRIINFK